MRLLIFLSILFILNERAHSEQAKSIDPSAKTNQSKKDTSNFFPLFKDEINTKSTQDSANTKDKKCENIIRESANNNRPIIVGTFLLAIFAMWQVIVAIRTARRQLRAYVAVIPMPVPGEYFLETTHLIVVSKATFIIVNSGQTPAHNVRIKYRSIAAIPESTNFSMLDSDEWENFGVVHKDVGVDFRAKIINYVDCAIEDIFKQRAIVYYWGIVEYDDVFGRRHACNYRYEVRSPKHKSDLNIPIRSQYGNDSD